MSRKLPISAVASTLVGLAIAVGVVVYVGLPKIVRAVALAGWPGFLFLCAATVATLLVLGASWWVLSQRHGLSSYPIYVWGRTVRDAATDILPFSQLGGFVVGSRAVIVQGVSESFAYASTVVDMTTEMLAQIVFTAAGLFILVTRASGVRFEDPLVVGPLIGLCLACAGAAGFILFQLRGGPLVGQLVQRFVPQAAGRAEALNTDLQALYGSRWRLAFSATLHLFAWLISAFHVLGVLQLMHPVAYIDCIAIESLVFAARSVAFMIPNAAGVQEGGYLLIGGYFGLNAEAAVALSLLKRGRDLIFGAPALVIWQVLEGRRLFLKAKPEAQQGRTP